MFLCLDMELCEITHIDTYLVRIFPLPRAVDNLDLNKISGIFVKLSPKNALDIPNVDSLLRPFSHNEIDIEKVIKEPAFFDERVTQDILEAYSINVARGRKFINRTKLYW